MTEFQSLVERMHRALEVPGISIPAAGVRFYFEDIPVNLSEYATTGVSVTSCQANRMSGLGDAILLTPDNIGCIAAAITFGFVDQHQDSALQGSRVYTDIMKDQSGKDEEFAPPSPEDFTSGRVYACKDSELPEFCLFGNEDSGRFKDVETAKKAIQGMTALQPAKTKGVFFFSPDFDEADVMPDVVTLDVRPVELTRLIQGYQYITGERIEANMGPVRVVNSDLIVRPYVSGKINVSSYCVGARLIGKYDANRLGMGIPIDAFKIMVQGLEASKTGYPFKLYPGANA